jgi:hypothetical protein
MTTRGHDYTHLVIATQGVITRNEAIHRPLNNGMDCHVAARLAMTTRGHDHTHPVIATQGVIARNEAIH